MAESVTVHMTTFEEMLTRLIRQYRNPPWLSHEAARQQIISALLIHANTLRQEESDS